MENKIKLNTIKKLIHKNEFIDLYENLTSETDEIIDRLSSPEYLDLKEHPNKKNVTKVIGNYENDVSFLIQALTILCKFRDNKHYNIISEIVDKFNSMTKNEKDGYGYIWRHLSNYPLLLIIYCLGTSFLKNNNIHDLYKLLNKKIVQRYAGKHTVETFKTTLIEGINSYHVFNNVDYMTVDIYPYLPVIGDFDPDKQSDVQKRLNANNRIFEYLSIYMTLYFRDRNDFSDYFDLYEFFTGLVFMDKRLKDDTLKFAPYGRRFWLYSGTGIYYQLKDTLIHIFLEEIRNRKNDVLKVGFFDGKLDRFEKALNEYQSLLSNIN